jgi:predicted PurR-regulated permease PerM
VSFIQATYLGLVFVLAGIPHAGIWALLCFILATVQIGPFLVVIPIIIYSFSTMDTTPAILWSIAMFAGTLIDNILKPILIGKGAPVPMLVIFIGAIGGFLLSGFIGLFTGAIVFSLGYTLFKAWLYEEYDHESLQDKSPQKTVDS